MDVSQAIRSKLNLLGSDGKRLRSDSNMKGLVPIANTVATLVMRRRFVSTFWKIEQQGQVPRLTKDEGEENDENEFVECSLYALHVKSRTRVVTTLPLEETKKNGPLQNITNSDLLFKEGSKTQHIHLQYQKKSKIKKLARQRGTTIHNILGTKREANNFLTTVTPKKVCVEG
ncbi:hypothetical protein PIB30_046417 [Stylosanthes scabra]|uniref:Uncharacterized protein n=1 Tax=Stylosanthes scabra TaxID=79078 RepID=A0ABU6UJQ9_9FABA|nr:hypothetical protein [Stylosanthes scabra]